MTKTNRSSSSTEPRRASLPAPSALFDRWFARTWTRALQDLSFSELRRSLQALSRRYVQDRDSLERGAALDGAGKRAAFAAFYAPLHLHCVAAVVHALGWGRPSAPRKLVDLGCGTGASSAGWIEALLVEDALDPAALPVIEGVDCNDWTLARARDTWRAFGARGKTRRASLESARLPSGSGSAVLAAWAINELTDSARHAALRNLRRAAGSGCRVLVVEPISRRTTPWWPEWLEAACSDGGAGAEWRVRPQLPANWWELDRAAKLDHRQVKLRTLSWPAAAVRGPV